MWDGQGLEGTEASKRNGFWKGCVCVCLCELDAAFRWTGRLHATCVSGICGEDIAFAYLPSLSLFLFDTHAFFQLIIIIIINFSKLKWIVFNFCLQNWLNKYVLRMLFILFYFNFFIKLTLNKNFERSRTKL